MSKEAPSAVAQGKHDAGAPFVPEIRQLEQVNRDSHAVPRTPFFRVSCHWVEDDQGHSPDRHYTRRMSACPGAPFELDSLALLELLIV